MNDPTDINDCNNLFNDVWENIWNILEQVYGWEKTFMKEMIIYIPLKVDIYNLIPHHTIFNNIPSILYYLAINDPTIYSNEHIWNEIWFVFEKEKWSKSLFHNQTVYFSPDFNFDNLRKDVNMFIDRKSAIVKLLEISCKFTGNKQLSFNQNEPDMELSNDKNNYNHQDHLMEDNDYDDNKNENEDLPVSDSEVEFSEEDETLVKTNKNNNKTTKLKYINHTNKTYYNFKSVRSALTAFKWKAMHPLNILDTDYIYCRKECRKVGKDIVITKDNIDIPAIRGIDYCIGEEELIQFGEANRILEDKDLFYENYINNRLIKSPYINNRIYDTIN